MGGLVQFALKLRLLGPTVKPGAIAIPDLVRICSATQEAVNRQAEALRGGSSLHPGPRSREILEECTLELTGIGRGSTVLPFRLAKPQIALLAGASLGTEAIRAIGEALQALASDQFNGAPKDLGFDGGVLDGIGELGRALDGVEAIEWIVPAGNGHKRLVGELNAGIRARVEGRRQEPRFGAQTVEGILEMADFRPADWRCRIRPAIGPAVTGAFAPAQAESVYACLRQPVRATGHAKIDPTTGRAMELVLESIAPVRGSRMGGSAFFESQTLEQLAAAQKVTPLRDPGVLVGGWPEDEDLDGFLDEIYAERHASADRHG